jgi:hypothetical protein
MSLLWRLLIMAGLWLGGCSTSATATSTPTSTPTLNTSLWVDYPVIANGYEQAATVVVNDGGGQPVVGATVIVTYVTPEGKMEDIRFPVTDDNGRSRMTLPVKTPAAISQIVILTAHVVENDRWGMSNASFQIVP